MTMGILRLVLHPILRAKHPTSLFEQLRTGTRCVTGTPK